MAKWKVDTPAGHSYIVEADTWEAADDAVANAPNAFAGGFDESQDSAPMAEWLASRDDAVGILDAGMAFVRGDKQPEGLPFSGSILPFSKDAQGNVSFDSDAGLVGMAKRAITFPMDAMQGKVDPLSDEGIARAVETASVASPVSAGTRGGLGWAGRPLRTRAPVETPTGQELLTTGGGQFDMARGMGVRYDPSAVNSMALNVRTQLLNSGFRKKNASGTFSELRGLIKSPESGAFATIDDLHAIRQALQKIPNTEERAQDRAAAGVLINAIDEFIRNPDPASVMAGPATAAGATWGKGMGNYAAGKRSDKLVDKPFSLEERAERRINPLSSGSTDKTIRDRVGALLDNPKTRSGFSAEEITLLESVKNGKMPRNVVSLIGNLLGAGATVATTVGMAATGAAFGGIPGAVAAAAPGATVLAARGLGGKLTKRALNKTAETVRKRSPLYEERMANAPAVPHASPAARSSVSRAVSQPMTQQQRERYEEYLRQKWALEQGA